MLIFTKTKLGFDENLTVALRYDMQQCVMSPTALVNVNMVAYGKINTRQSPTSCSG